ncbi:MAG: hypothetical protein DMF52_10205 [Acidobacteria bacterium]|nr:MAG: hypothetical protein DMF52_10205 [Acidobacteriota bacterium]
MSGAVDVIVLGAGHNGLVAAAYLARAGVKTLVVERRPIVGGACVTEELLPGYRFSTASYVLSLLRPEIIRDLRLREHGLEILPCRASFTPFPDGRSLLLGLGDREDARQIARFSGRDAEAYPRFNTAIARAADFVRPTLAMTPPRLPSPGIGDFVFLHYYLGEANGSPGSWGFVKGGMGGVAESLAAAVRSHGAAIRVGAAVERILVKDGVARGVILEGGEEIRSRIVVSNADPKRTFLRMVERSQIPAEFVRGIENLRCTGNSAKINLALSELPDFTALPGDGPHLRGSIQVCGAHPDYLEDAFEDYRSGRPSRRPYLDIVIPSTVDTTLAPSGHHVMSISVKFVPYHLAEGDWKTRKETLGDLTVETLAAYAPNVRRAILYRQVLTPLCLEEVYGLTGGNICHGDMALDQLFAMRPLLGWARYRTPIDNLYLCGSGTHPGGGVMGAPGRNAARVILKDLRRARLRTF